MKALAHELGINPTDTILISTSRFVPKNAYSDMIDALTYLPENVKLLALGSGPLEKTLKEKTMLLKLENRVKFVGFVHRKEIPLYMSISHIFVRPSLSEGMGVSFVEAMAAGLPIIATKVGGIPDFLFDRKTGLFCEVENPKSLAEKVELLMNNPELKETIVKNAKELVREKYDWNLIADEMRSIFEKL
jgi:glycosyltransferase involved in cell wall biosynthesis